MSTISKLTDTADREALDALEQLLRRSAGRFQRWQQSTTDKDMALQFGRIVTDLNDAAAAAAQIARDLL
jgi:hypothetical protein